MLCRECKVETRRRRGEWRDSCCRRPDSNRCRTELLQPRLQASVQALELARPGRLCTVQLLPLLCLGSCLLQLLLRRSELRTQSGKQLSGARALMQQLV